MLLAAQVGGGGHDSLAAYIEGYLAAAKSGSVVLSPGLLSVLWESVRWPLFAFLMGFTALGVLGIPTLFAVRGFLLSFAAAGGIIAFTPMFGKLFSRLPAGINGSLLQSLPSCACLEGQGGFWPFLRLGSRGLRLYRRSSSWVSRALQVRGNLRAGPCPGRRACFPLGGLIGSAALCVPAQLRSARCWNTGRVRHCCARWPDSFDFGAVRRV